MGVDPRGPGVARAGEGADDSLAVERSPESLVAHVGLDDVGDRRLEHDRQQLVLAAQELGELIAVGRFADPGIAGTGAQTVAQTREQCAVAKETVDIAR